jgi:hypothetical protein
MSAAPIWPATFAPVFTSKGTKVHAVNVTDGLRESAYEWTLCGGIHVSRVFLVGSDFDGEVCRTCASRVERLGRVQASMAVHPATVEAGTSGLTEVWRGLQSNQSAIDALCAAVEELIARVDAASEELDRRGL